MGAPNHFMDCSGLSKATAAILAGGFGTRLQHVVGDRPKVLAEVRGRPFLSYLLDQLGTYGVRSVVLCTGYLGEQVQAIFGDSYNCLRLIYSHESSPLGTAGALRLAFPLLESDSILVMNGDSFYDVNLNSFWTWHCELGAKATILLTRMSDTNRFGRVHVNADGVAYTFEEKTDKNGPGWINTGIYLFTRPLLQTIPVGCAVSLEKDMFPAWSSQGLYGYRSEGRFLDIGTPEAYKAAEQFFVL